MGEAVAPATGWRWLVWLFAALGVVAAIAIIWLAVVLVGVFPSRERAIVARDHASGEMLEVDNVRLLEGTGLIAIEIGAVDDRGIKGSSGSYSGDDARNLLLLDRQTGVSRRVLPDNASRIAEIAYFPATADGARSALDDIAEEAGEAPPAYYLLTLERRLQNGDRVFDLLVGTLATGRQGIVMRGLSGVEQTSMLDTTRLGVVVREGKELHYRVIDIPALRQVESYKIEIG